MYEHQNNGEKDKDSNSLIKRLKESDEAIFRKIYDEYRPAFLNWVLAYYKLDRDEALDIFQETLTVLYFNVYSEQMEQLNSSLKTYIFAVAKNQIHKRIRDHNHIELYSDVNKAFDEEALKFTDPKLESNECVRRIKEIIGNLEEPCKSILELTYIKNFSNQVIAEKLGFKNTDVVKARKWRCLKSLRKKLG